MATTVKKPDLDEQLEWGAGREESEVAAAAPAAAVAGAGAAGGLRELVYRVDDWRIERKARRYERSVRRAPRRQGIVAAVVVALALVAMAAALAIGNGGSSAPHVSAAPVQIFVPNHTARPPPAGLGGKGPQQPAPSAARQPRGAAKRHGPPGAP